MPNETIPVTVKILEKEYRIACAPNHKESLEKSAASLNDKMKEIRSTGKVIGSDRIAVMAALNLAHDLLNQKQQVVESESFCKQARQMRDKINRALNYSQQIEITSPRQAG